MIDPSENRPCGDEFMADGLCSQTDPDAFFPERSHDVRAAKAICRSCPVIAACLDYALATDQRHGVWGGTSQSERQVLRRQRRILTAAQQRVRDNRTTARRLYANGVAKTEISRALKVGITTVTDYLTRDGDGRQAA